MRREKKDGTYPVVFKITVQRKQAIISTGFSVTKESFCKKTSMVLGSPEINRHLLHLDSIYRPRFYQYITNHNTINDIDDLKKYLLNKPVNEILISEFWKETIEHLRKSNRLGSMKNYEQALRTISTEINLDQPFVKLSYKDLILLEGRLFQRGMSVNGMAVYLRVFRAICNRAIKHDIVGYDWYPFRKYTVKKTKTTPRVLSIEEMKSYLLLNYPSDHPKFKAWHVGRLLFLLRGINLKDLMLLMPSDVKNGRITYTRSKTGKLYSIKLTEEMKQSFSVFTPDYTLMGMMTKQQLESNKAVEHFRQKVKIMNKHLRKIGAEAGNSIPLSTYVFRYTYANIAKQLGYSKDLIAEALGHEYGNRITGIYLEQFDQEIIDDMNLKIIKFITKR